MIRQLIFSILMLVFATVHAQDIDKLYKEGKALYDAKQYTEAIAKLRPAAERGHKKAQYRMGRAYDKGNGVAEDNAKAFYWYAKSAAQDYAKAQYQVGRCYKKGKGTDKDLKKAVLYFTRAARQGNADAQLALGKCYLKGQGVKADRAKAKSWCLKAIKNEKGGKDVLAELRQEAADGDKDAESILNLIK